MVSDANKSLQISYNYLNLPSVITVTGKGTITYVYDAAGNKLQKRTIDNMAIPAITTVTDYIGSSVYQNDTLQFFGTSEGNVRPNGAGTIFVYDYFLKDHLGNTRMVITDDYNVASPILEATSSYPFGEQMKNINLEASGSLHNKKWTFQHQEYNDDLGVDIEEFKYRMNDPQTGRFWQIDPLADDYEYNSPYAFSEDKITSGRELEGLEYEPLIEEGEEVAEEVEQYVEEISAAAQNPYAHVIGFFSAATAWLAAHTLVGNMQSPLPADVHINITSPQRASITPKTAIQAKSSNKRDNTYDRVKPRKGTVEKVKEKQPKNEKGEMLDPNTGKVLDPDKTDLGHKTGNE